MKAGTLLENAEGILMITGIAIAGYLVWKGYGIANKGASTIKSVADMAARTYTTAMTKAGAAVTETEIAVKKIISPDSIVYSASGSDGTSTRQDALNMLNGLRTAKAVTDTLPQNAPFTLWRDFTDWYQADTTGKAVRDSFYDKNPDGVFYD
jgi:predicted Zn-dependent protease